ncbi:hypothetical protein BURK1_00575 [Burkholderiales bacterium]|nr:hypothetical protein BURK1_00575 [Burkholderiales bacterium]
MNRIRKIGFGILGALSLAAMTSPAAAAPEKKFSISITPAAVSVGNVRFTMAIKNETPNGNSNINSIAIPLPAGYNVESSDSGTSAPSATWAGAIAAPDGADVITISNMSPLKPLQGFTLTFWAKVSAAACSSALWDSAQAWSGSSFSGNTFRQLYPPEAAVNITTTVGGAQSLQFDASNPTSAAKGTPVALKVNLSSSCAGPAPNATVTLGSSPLAFTGGSSQASSGGVATFTVTFNATGATSLTATAAGFTSATPASLTVFDGILDCATDTDPPFDARDLPAPDGTDGSFDASAGGATDSEDTAFIVGIRGLGDTKGNTDCTLLNYSIVNNIPDTNTTSLTDPLGNIVPPGFYSFSFDSAVPNPVVAILSTYRPEWGDPVTGLPTRKTLICAASVCTTAPTYDVDGNVELPWKVASSCLSTLVTHASIPAGESGCVARETWWPVALASCPSPAPTGPNVRCLQLTATVIVGHDPVFGR